MTVPARLISKATVAAMTGMSKPTIWRHEKAGTFPKGRNVGARRRWDEAEIHAWMTALSTEMGGPVGVKKARLPIKAERLSMRAKNGAIKTRSAWVLPPPPSVVRMAKAVTTTHFTGLDGAGWTFPDSD